MPREDLEALIAGGPAPTVEDRPFIGGLAPGYLVPRDVPVPDPRMSLDPSIESTRTVGVPPRYKAGDEWQPASLPPEDIARLQQTMAGAGLIAKGKKFQLGVWDDTSRTAYYDLLAFANASGLDEKEALTRWSEQHAKYGETKEPRQPLTVELTNPATLRKIIDNGSRSVLGRKLAAGEEAALVAAYQAQEQAYQEQAYGMAETGGTVVRPPAADAYVEEQIRAKNPAESGAHDIAETGDEFFALLKTVGGSFGG